MSFAPIQCNCTPINGIGKRGTLKVSNQTSMLIRNPDETWSISSGENKDQTKIHDADMTFNSKEETWSSKKRDTIVNCIQRTVYGNSRFSHMFTQLNLVCSDKLCVFKINSDALRKLVLGNFIEENGMTIEIKDDCDEIQRKRLCGNKTESVDIKKLKLSKSIGVIGDRGMKIYSKLALGEEQIVETETLARITWEISKRCNVHKEPLYFVCEICNRIICHKCIIDNHQGHKIVVKHTESAYATAKKMIISLGNVIKDTENLLCQIEVILKEIPCCANEAADCIVGLLNSWEYPGSCIHRRPYLLKLIDTIKTLKIRDLELQQINLIHLLFRMKSDLTILQQSVLSENAINVTYASMTAREDFELAKKYEYGFVPVHNKEFRIALKAKTIKRIAAVTVLSTTVVDPVKKMALKKIPFEDAARFWKLYQQKIGFNEFKMDLTNLNSFPRQLWCFGREGNGEGELCRPWGIACDKTGRFFVSDRSNNRIQVFNSDGTYAFTFGSFGTEKGELNRPAGITIDIFNRAIVSDKDNHRIQIFTLNGEYVFHFGSVGNLPGQFNYPWDVCTNTRGDIAVSDTKNRRVQLFTKTGRLNGIVEFYPYDLKFFDLPRAVRFNTKGELVVGDFNNHRFIVFDQVFSSFKLFGIEGQFNRPQGLCVDEEGNHIIADSKNSRVVVYDKNFKLFREIKNDVMKNPQGLCLTPKGNIAVVDMEYHRVLIL